MKRHLLRCGGVALMLGVLSSCGGGATNSTNPVPVATSIAGVASKGPVKNGDVTVWALRNDGTRGSVLAKGIKTLPDGSYSADIGDYNGNILVEVTGGTYQDEATGTETMLSIPLRAALAGAKGNVTLAVTPLTELAVRRAGDRLTKASIDEANAIMGIMAGGISISAARPVDASKSAGKLVDDSQYGLMLAAISQMSLNKGWTLDRVLEYIREDLDDGVAQSAAADLKASLQDFIAGSNNKSEVTDLSEISIDNALDLVSDPANPVFPPAGASDLAKAKSFITDFRNTVSSLSNYKGMNSGDMLKTPFNRLSYEIRTQIEPMLASVNGRVSWIVQSCASFLDSTPWSGRDRAGNTIKIDGTGTPGTVIFTVTAPNGATVDSGTLTVHNDSLGNPTSGHLAGVIRTKAGDMNVDLDFTGTLKNNMYESVTFTGEMSAPGFSIDFKDTGRKMSATLAPDPDNVSGYNDVYPTSAYLSSRITTKTASFDGTFSLPEIVWSSKQDMDDSYQPGPSVCIGGPVVKSARFTGSFAELVSGKETGLKFSGALSAKFHNAATFNNCALESATNFKSWSAQFDGKIEAPNRPAFEAFLKAEERQKDVTDVSIKYTRRTADGRIVYLSGSGQLLSNSTKTQRFSFKDQNGLDFSVDFNDNLPCTRKFTGSIKTPGGEKLAELDTLNQTCVPTVRYTDGYFESIL